jgi:hypothetical protein
MESVSLTEPEPETELPFKPDPNSFLNTLNEESDIFNRIRKSMKKIGDMFLFGKPTEKIMTLMLKIYHENLIRILLRDTLNTYPKEVKCMTGILELNNGDIYIAISEEPDEDPAYAVKLKMLVSILKQTNVNVTMDEPEMRARPDTIFSWRGRESGSEYKAKVITKNQLQNNNNVMFMENPLENDGGNTKYNYDNTLWETPMNVNVINSEEYLAERKKGNSFVPFKKISTGKKYKDEVLFECNNGSTCSEAKLFSYMYNDLGLNFKDIKGFVAYWVGNDTPPKHIIANYCFSSLEPAENERLDELTRSCIPYLSESIKSLYTKYGSKSYNVIKNAINPLALACPGCVANYVPYTTGAFSNWDNLRCIQNGYFRSTASAGGSAKNRKSYSHNYKKRKTIRRRSSHRRCLHRHTKKKCKNKRRRHL